jgi:hypothetical protein
MAKMKDPAPVALGREGGKARMDTMTPEERSEIARTAGLASAAKRWEPKKAAKKRSEIQGHNQRDRSGRLEDGRTGR